MKIKENNIYNKLLEDIERKYVDFYNPTFSFVDVEMNKQPYKAILKELSNTFFIKDITDINEDCSFRYLLRERKEYVLELSMIGPYTVVLKKCGCNNYNLIDGDMLKNEEEILFKIIDENQIHVLSKEVLESPIRLKLNYAEDENVKIYHALFSDSDYLPWNEGKI